MKFTLSSFFVLALVLAFVSSEVAEASSKSCRARKHHHGSKKHHKSSSSSATSNTNNDATTSTSTNSTSSKSSSDFTPNGRKAGIAGGDSLNQMRNVIGWMTTWTPNPYPGTKLGDVDFATMMWGIGETDHDNDAQRFAEFKKIPAGKYKYVIGMNEADFQGGGSSGVISTEKAAAAWEEYIAPHGKAGSVLISPSCAKQQDEDWMGPFLKAVKTQPDIINVHIFKNKASEISTVLDHFAKYGKPMWITEMACINYSNGAHEHCSQSETTEFLNEAVKILEADDRVKAYAWSDADNGPTCKLTSGNKLSTTGQQLERVFSSLTKRSMTTKMLR